MQKLCYDTFITKTEVNLNKNTKHFWAFVKSKKDNNSIPDTLYLDNSTVSEGSTIAHVFNTFFQSVFESHPEATSTYPPYRQSECIINSVRCSEDIVKKYLSKVDANKGSGPDGIHPYFIKMCCKQLAAPIAYLFRLSLSSAVMPLVWKQSLVVPIHKNGDKHNIRNYRGISKLSVIPKLFEKIVFDSLNVALRPIFISQQHGFVAGRSTETNLCEFLDQVLCGMNNGFQVDAVYTDYSKCFDKISHQILVRKLENIGIHGDLLRWLQSYLENRTQAVTVKGFKSSFIPITSGVPQGSHLGPLFFNIFINDVSQCFQNSKFLLFADDTKIFSIIKSVEDCVRLQEDLDRLCDYCTINKLTMNVDKCSSITFSRKKTEIKFNYKLFAKDLTKKSENEKERLMSNLVLSLENHARIDTIVSFNKCGRVCLAHHSRMYSILNGPLQKIYTNITEIPLVMGDKWPTCLCYICYHMIRRLHKFIDKSLKANKLLLQLISSDSESP
ncbi:hypothetical protein evm_013878 [Chilo suppressalis]|nr:hypothetical protein evm_013878 [Chilo suppressalis]